jgi:two-component system chemotaxis sensor kinase CheA
MFHGRDPADGIIVVVQSGASLLGLLVDGLLHRQEVVIKNIGEMIRQRDASIAGATILGDGRVGLIIDVNALGGVNQCRNHAVLKGSLPYEEAPESSKVIKCASNSL